MINVVDRVPTYPNRIKVTKSDGTSEYVTWERADEPTVPGTPINKALFDSIVEDIGLNANKTVYVSTAGSDALGDGTAANPYATINKAINSIPKNMNGFDATINIAAGTYEEDVWIARTFGGIIIFNGVAGAVVNIRSIRIAYGASVQVQNIEMVFTGSYNGNAISVNDADFVCLSKVSVTGNVENGVFASRNAFFCAYVDLVINNTTYAAIHSTNRSSVFVSVLSGTAASGSFMRAVNGSSISFYSSSATAPVIYSTSAGGRIYSGAQVSIPNY